MSGKLPHAPGEDAHFGQVSVRLQSHLLSLTLPEDTAQGHKREHWPMQETAKSLSAQGKPATALLLSFMSSLAVSVAVAQTSQTNTLSQLAFAEVLSDLPESCRAAISSSQELANVARAVSAAPTADRYCALGSKLSQSGQDSCAIPLFESALKLKSDHTEARYGLASALIRTGKPQQALPHLRLLVERNPGSFQAHNALGLALQDLGQQSAAENEFRTALGINPRSVNAAFNLAKLLGSEKKFAAQVYYLQEALKSNPSEELIEPLQLSLASAFENKGETDRAIDVLQRFIGSHPSSSAAHGDLGTIYAKHFRFLEAKPEYERILGLDPNNDEARLSLAKVLVELGDDTSAIIQVRQYTQHAPKDFEGQFVLGQAYRRVGEYEKAAAALRRAAELSPDNYHVHYNLGLVLARSGQLDDAVQELEAAKKLNPLASEAPYQLSLILRKKHEFQHERDEATAFQQAKARSEGSINASVSGSRGNDLLVRGDYKNAAEAYREALKLEPDSAKLHYNLSLALEGLREIEEETREVQEAIYLDPNYAEAHNQLGTLALRAGKLADAERQFRAALELNPRYAEAENNLGTLYGRAGRVADAIGLFQKATEDDPKYAGAFLNWGLVLASQEKYSEAAPLLQKATELSPNEADAYTALGMVELKQDAPKKALSDLEKAASFRPTSFQAHLNLGLALAEQYKLGAALDEFRKAIALAPNSAAAHYSMGRTLYDLGGQNEARVELENACHLSPDNIPARYLLALIEKQEGHLVKSAELLKKLVELQPRHSAAQFLLGQTLLGLGREQEAVAHWRSAVEADPNNAEALYNLTRILSKEGSPEARTYLEQYRRLEASQHLSNQVLRLRTFAMEAASAHNWPQAVSQLKEALQLCGQCEQRAELHRNLGLIYCREGDMEGGARELRTALKLNPEDPDALKAIELLETAQNENPSAVRRKK